MHNRKGGFRPTVFLYLFLMTGAISCCNAGEGPSLGTAALRDYAEERYEAGYRDDAAHEFQKLLLVDPTNPAARAYLDETEVKKEMPYLKKQIAMLTARQKELEKATTQACRVKGDGIAGTALCDYAQELYEAGDREDAKHEFAKLLIIDPRNRTADAFLREPGMDKEMESLRQRIAALTARLNELAVLEKRSRE